MYLGCVPTGILTTKTDSILLFYLGPGLVSLPETTIGGDNPI